LPRDLSASYNRCAIGSLVLIEICQKWDTDYGKKFTGDFVEEMCIFGKLVNKFKD